MIERHLVRHYPDDFVPIVFQRLLQLLSEEALLVPVRVHSDESIVPESMAVPQRRQV
jgi:hypothetical protein